MLDVLVIAPHPDDAELGMGGSIALMLAEGYRVGVLDLTDGEPTPRGSREQRRRETDAATKVLGIPWRQCLGLPNRSMENTLDARWALAGVLREQRPKVIFVPYWEDAHPDHVAVTRLAEAARFWTKLTKSDIPGEPLVPPRLYYYFCTHLRVHERPAFVLDISSYFELKMRAVECYQSQFAQNPDGSPSVLDDVRARSRYWGWSIARAHGEPFASREAIGLVGLRSLL